MAKRQARCLRSWAFHGKEAAKEVSKAFGHGRNVSLGEQQWLVGDARVFVLPSASGSNRDATRLEGKADRIEWFKELLRAWRKPYAEVAERYRIRP